MSRRIVSLAPAVRHQLWLKPAAGGERLKSAGCARGECLIYFRVDYVSGAAPGSSVALEHIFDLFRPANLHQVERALLLPSLATSPTPDYCTALFQRLALSRFSLCDGDLILKASRPPTAGLDRNRVVGFAYSILRFNRVIWPE